MSAVPEIDLDATDLRIRAYLASVMPLRGCCFYADPQFHRGRGVIERIAFMSREQGPSEARLTVAECADAIAFMGMVELIDPARFHAEPEGEPSALCGQYAILDTIARELRAKEAA